MRLVLTDGDVQTLINALRAAEEDCQEAAALVENPEAFLQSANQYRKLLDRLKEAEQISYP